MEPALDQLDGQELRRTVALVPQDPHLFDASLADNIRLGRPQIGPERIWQAVDQVKLGDWIRALPDGLHTPAGRAGAFLSAGQRHRLALARALVTDAPILLLDEAGEHLDPQAADALTADLLAAGGDRAVVLATHRLRPLATVDEILVLSAGRVIQRGSHAGLVAVPGPYRRLWELECRNAALTAD